MLSRSYGEKDIVYPLQDPEEKLVIREWSYLTGSGAEIYFQRGEEKPILIGQTNGEENDTPFKDGAFEIIQNGRFIEVSWRFRASRPDRSHWRTNSFELPGDS